MNYLQPADYEPFGLAADTPDAWITAASAMIDAYCRRPTLAAQTYTERLRPGRGLPQVRVSYGPLIAVASVRARFGRGSDNLFADTFFHDIVAQTFCTPGAWVAVDPTTLDVATATGEISFPCNLLGHAYSEVEVTYTAGVTDVPAAVKVACAQIVKNAQATPALNVKSSRVDTLQMEYFSGTLLDPQVCALLRPFVAERLSR